MRIETLLAGKSVAWMGSLDYALQQLHAGLVDEVRVRTEQHHLTLRNFDRFELRETSRMRD